MLAIVSSVVVISAGFGVFLAAHRGWRLPMFLSHPEADSLVLIVAAQCAVNLTSNTVYSVFQAMQETLLGGAVPGLRPPRRDSWRSGGSILLSKCSIRCLWPMRSRSWCLVAGHL